MRTTKSRVKFQGPFILNKEVGELPAGSYDIEIDEEEMLTPEWSGHRRTAIYFYVQDHRSTRMLVIDPIDLDSALERDAGCGKEG